MNSVTPKYAISVRLALVVLFLASLWLRAGYPVFGIWGQYDDALFLRLANATPWLGNYDEMVLAKGAFFPLFVAANKLLGLPLKLVEHALYLIAAILLAHATAVATGRRWLFLVVFAVLALSPIPWTVEGGSRVTREPLYQSLTLIFFALTALILFSQRRQLALSLWAGLAGGCYWLTREEGIWLLPTLAVLVLSRWQGKSPQGGRLNPQALREAIVVLTPALLGFLTVVLAVNAMNLKFYGVFRNNEFRAGPFPAAYGALARIKHDSWRRYVVFPRDARQRAYSVSPAAKELSSFFEGDAGKFWTKVSQTYPKPWGCQETPATCNDEILSAWFVWALRDAVAKAGHYESAATADMFYERMAREINTACDRQDIPCKRERNSLVPVWRGHYGRDALAASTDVFMTLVNLNRGHVGVPASQLTPEQVSVFHATTHDPLNGIDNAAPVARSWQSEANKIRLALTQRIASYFASVSLPLVVIAMASCCFIVFAWLRIKSAAISANSVVFLSALFVAVVSRLGLLGFLEATSIPSNNLLYLLPAVPMYLVFLVVSLGLAISAIMNMLRSRQGFPA